MAEESKQSELANDDLKTDRSVGSVVDERFADLEESLDFDVYVDDIAYMTDEENEGTNVISSGYTSHFTDPSSDSPKPIPFNLSSLKEVEADELGSKPFSEDELDDILLRDTSDDTDIALSESELNNIVGGSEDSHEGDQFEDRYDTFIEEDDEDNITLATDELDQILNPDEDEDSEENEFVTKSFFDTEDSANEDDDIALSPDELNNITSLEETDSTLDETANIISDPPSDLFEYSENEDDIALSGDELNNILESGEVSSEDEISDESEIKSFFDTDESGESEEEIALSPEELSRITDSEYSEEDGIETEDFDPDQQEQNISFDTPDEEESIALSGDELNNILESGEASVEEEEEDFDIDNAKSFFDTDDGEESIEEDESISLSPDELGNITAEENFEVEDAESPNDSVNTDDNFDLSEVSDELNIDETSSDLFESSNEDEGEISLSGDELNNILESGEIESEEVDTSGNSFFEESNEAEDDSISLSADELGNITADENYEVEEIDNSNEISNESDDTVELTDASDEFAIEESQSDLFESSNEDEGEISLSGDELNNILESGEIESEEVDTSGNSLFEESNEEDDSISLSADELGNITADENYEVEEVDNSDLGTTESEDNFSLSDVPEDLDVESPSSFFEEESVADDDIALSGDELNNILETGNLETEEADYSNPIDSGMVINDDDFVIDENSSLSDLGDVTIDETGLDHDAEATDSSESFHFGNVRKEELRKVISYMDELLGSLPDSYIKDFASSEYFELYKKIMNELEL